MILIFDRKRCMTEYDSYGTKDRAFLGLEGMSRSAGYVLMMVNVSSLISDMILNTIKHGNALTIFRFLSTIVQIYLLISDV